MSVSYNTFHGDVQRFRDSGAKCVWRYVHFISTAVFSLMDTICLRKKEDSWVIKGWLSPCDGGSTELQVEGTSWILGYSEADDQKTIALCHFSIRCPMEPTAISSKGDFGLLQVY